jgi:hypothetical protein
MVAVQPAGVADRTVRAYIEEARRRSHDQLCEMLGEHRRGPVTWLEWEAEAGIRAIKRTLDDGRPEWAALIRFLEDRPNGLLILATAPCSRQAQPW